MADCRHFEKCKIAMFSTV